MITIENNGSDIILFGRNDNKTPYVITDTNFKPYLYYDNWKGNFKTIDGKPCSKLILNNPFDGKQVRDKLHNEGKQTYESDVRYVNRYIIDKVSELKKEPIRICYLDIEIARTEKGYEHFSLANNPILMIGCFDNFDKEKVRFILKDYNNENQMLRSFLKYINEKDPDVLVAWNGDAFDFPFLINRINKIGLNAGSMARCNKYKEVQVLKHGVKIFGRICFDLMRAYQKMNPGGRESWALDYISQYHKLGGKEKYKGELDDLYNNDINTFIKYNDRDVELLVLLDEKLNIINYFDEVRRLCFCRLDDIFMNTKMAECLCLKYAKDKYILPDSKRDEEQKSITGAFVKNSEPKLHQMVAVMDMKSLYPSIMIGFNTSYETLLNKKEDNCINMFDTYYYKKEKGIIPSIVKPLLDKRKQVAKEMNIAREKFGKESVEYKTLYLNQYSLKQIANSFYGVLLEKHFRLSKREVGQSITFAAQNIIKEVHRWFEERGMSVIYGDTDSCFIKMDNRTIEQMKDLNSEINKYFKEFFKKYNVEDENNIFRLEFEKVFKTVLFKRKGDGTGAKKRYAGRMIWYDGKPVDEIHIAGFETVRSDMPQIGRNFMKEVLTKILNEVPKEEVDKCVDDFKNKISKGEFQPEEIGLPIGITKPLEKYGNQIHARASKIANEKYNAGIKQGDKVKYVFVKGGDVIAFKKYLYEGYQVDYDRMIKRIVDMKIGPLYEGLGWEYIYLNIVNHNKKIKEVALEDIYKQKSLWI